MAIYKKRLVAPATSNTYYYGNLNIFSACGVGMEKTTKNPVGGNCTCYAWGRLYELTGKRYTSLTGNAEDWFAKASSVGLKTGTSPKVGAIVCWQAGKANNSSDGCGHVAVVEEVNTDGSIVISESGWNTYVFKTETVAKGYARGTYKFLGFIYCGLEFEDENKYTYEGYLDSSSATGFSGWCWNGVDDTACKVTIKIYQGTTLKKTLTTTANIYRSDLLSAKKGNGKHGYTVTYDLSGLGVGTYTIKAYAPDGKALINVKSVVVNKIFSTAINTKFVLKNTPVYNSETTGSINGTRTGTYYIYKNNTITNGRIRMTNTSNGGAVSFFCNVEDLKKL